MSLRHSQSLGKPFLIFDGICNLCTTVVRFLLAVEKGRSIRYVPFQRLDEKMRAAYGLTLDDLQGRMYFIGGDGELSGGSVALSEVCKLLFPITFVCDIFKSAQARRLYDWVADHRYRIFGCRGSCYVIPPGPAGQRSRPK